MRLRWSWPLLGAALLLLPACSPPEHVGASSPTPTPRPTPEPSPTPLYVPYKRLDTGRLFNGISLQTTFSTEPGGPATAEVTSSSAYSLQLDLHVRIPRAVDSQEGLVALDPELPALFPQLGVWLKSARVSPFYERLYRHKVASLEQSFLRLDQLLTRHDFFDCETILEIAPPPVPPATAPRRILWIQSAMDTDSDGSDSDRVPDVDANSETFQPITSYKWPKRGANPNPFLAERQARIETLQASLDAATTDAQHQQIMDSIGAAQWDIKQLSTKSFLVAADDPYIVVPSFTVGQKDDPFSPAIGDYCAVVYGGVIYPAIIGDAGPSNKIGEASLRIAQELNPLATSENRPVSPLKVTYLIFPGTADHPFAPPDLAHWRDRVDALLKEAGGYNGQLFVWKDLTVPTPTPTPPPTPTPSPTPESSASPDPSASALPSPSASVSPSTSP
ncbi:MAG: glycoside hydrolase family 75 protein [Chthoniobacteraceae bacterium]|jgi:hypothetical protein